MSTIKARRRNQKKFIERDQENEIGVMDESNLEYMNKIQEKQQDKFDPHKLRQNILQQNQKSYQNNFIDFGDDDIVQQTTQNKQISKPNIEKQEIKQTQSTIKKAAGRKRGKKQKKLIQSDDEDIVEESQIKGNQAFSQITVEDNVNMLKRQQNLGQHQEMDPSQHSDQQKQQEAIQQILQKKSQSQKPIENYVLIHNIMNKVGFNKHDRRAAIYTPLNPGEHSFVFFKRYQSGFSEYYQAIGEDQRPILFCQNQRGCIGCNYYISLTKQMDKNNPAYLGKLRGNAAGSIYQLYDNGTQPNNQMNRSKFRVSMAYIEYQSNFLGMKGPRKLKAVIPSVKQLEDFDMFKLTQEQSLNNFQPPNVINMRNKQPRWNDRLKSYALNFGGRVKQASIKNFILMDDRYNQNEQDKAPNLIVFGKIDQNTFALQFRHPLNLFQAFGIAMSQFDFKLKCE